MVEQVSTLETSRQPLSYKLDALETTPQSLEPTSPLGIDQPPGDVGVIFRHTSWSGSRQCVDTALEGIVDGEGRLDRFRTCGRNGWVLRSVENPELYRVQCDKCKDRFCVPCAGERSRHIAACVQEFACGREIRFITLTLRKSGRSLSDDLDRLYAGFVRLRRRTFWTKSQKGGIAFVEIKRRRGDDGWHVHLHALSEGHYIGQNALSQAWHQITGDSFIVNVRWCDSPHRAAYYAAKYAGKGIHGNCYLDPDVLREAILALTGRRLVAKWGTWRELDLMNFAEPGLWLAVDSLARLLRRRDSGDPVARGILEILLGERSCDTARSPPVECG